MVAKFGSLSAEATLDVTAGNAVATGVVAGGGVIVQPPGVTITDGGERVFPAGTATTDTQSTGDLTTVDVKAAHLVVTPDPLALWVGEAGSLGSVRLDPGGGQPSFPVDFQVTAPDGQTVVKVDYDNKIVGLAKGGTQVTVTPSDPKLQGLSANVAVQVDNPDPLSIDPADMALQVGESTPPVMVSGKGPGRHPLPGAGHPGKPGREGAGRRADAPGRFVAKAMGRTQLKARYKGVELFATVTVPGKRFIEVKTTPKLGAEFDVTIEVLASAAEGPLAYRVYVEGETTPDTWTPNEPQGDSRHVVLHSPKLSYGQAGHTLPPHDRGPRCGHQAGAAISADAPPAMPIVPRGKKVVSVAEGGFSGGDLRVKAASNLSATYKIARLSRFCKRSHSDRRSVPGSLACMG